MGVVMTTPFFSKTTPFSPKTIPFLFRGCRQTPDPPLFSRQHSFSPRQTPCLYSVCRQPPTNTDNPPVLALLIICYSRPWHSEPCDLTCKIFGRKCETGFDFGRFFGILAGGGSGNLWVAAPPAPTPLLTKLPHCVRCLQRQPAGCGSLIGLFFVASAPFLLFISLRGSLVWCVTPGVPPKPVCTKYHS